MSDHKLPPRFHCICEYDEDGIPHGKMFEVPIGSWVRYSDWRAERERAEKAEVEVVRLRKDAARYQHWRTHHGWTGYFDDGASNSEEPDDIDAAIDAAIAAEQEDKTP